MTFDQALPHCQCSGWITSNPHPSRLWDVCWWWRCQNPLRDAPPVNRHVWSQWWMHRTVRVKIPVVSFMLLVNTLRHRQNGQNFVKDVYTVIELSLNIFTGLIDSKAALVQCDVLAPSRSQTITWRCMMPHDIIWPIRVFLIWSSDDATWFHRSGNIGSCCGLLSGGTKTLLETMLWVISNSIASIGQCLGL